MGASWAPLGGSWAAFGRSLGLFFSFLCALGCILEALWLQRVFRTRFYYFFIVFCDFFVPSVAFFFLSLPLFFLLKIKDKNKQKSTQEWQQPGKPTSTKPGKYRFYLGKTTIFRKSDILIKCRKEKTSQQSTKKITKKQSPQTLNFNYFSIKF